ncbi:hypothetical protein HanPI659440_Chr13g0514531 [Helianthus annuus]|nr:hypothetical protein HanPI659440_Chr13g0514531 [Helianthus annuus]
MGVHHTFLFFTYNLVKVCFYETPFSFYTNITILTNQELVTSLFYYIKSSDCVIILCINNYTFHNFFYLLQLVSLRLLLFPLNLDIHPYPNHQSAHLWMY